MNRTFGQPNYSIFNPPDYWTQMITDPTQVPVQLYPYGGGGHSPYGPYPGFYMGARTMTYADAEREARRRQKFMEQRAAVSPDPSHRYLTPEGRLKGKAGAVYNVLQAQQARPKKQPNFLKTTQQKVVATVLLGAVLSALLR